MSWQFIGEGCALGSAFVWALAVVLFKRSGEQVTPLALNLFKNTIAVVLLAVTLALMPGGCGGLLRANPAELAIMVLSGVLGIAIADTLIFRALNLCGVGILSIVDCAYAPLVIAAAVLIVGEPLTAGRIVGAGLIVLAVLLVSRHPPPPDRTPRQIVQGVLIGLGGLATMAVGITFAKLALEYNDFPLIEATLVRMLAGTLFLAALAAASPRRATYFGVFRPARVWRFSVPGAVLGGYLSLILWMAGFKWADASIAAVLNQTTVFFSLALATLLLGEHFGRRKAAATALAVSGVLLATWAR